MDIKQICAEPIRDAQDTLRGLARESLGRLAGLQYPDGDPLRKLEFFWSNLEPCLLRLFADADAELVDCESRCQLAVRQEFERELQDWLKKIVARLLPADWRQQLAAFLERLQSESGLTIALEEATADLEQWILRSSTARQKPGLGTADVGLAGATKRQTDSSAAAEGGWPALSEEDRRRNRQRAGIGDWWPIQPVMPGDADWERRIEAAARRARERLHVVFHELAALGRLAGEAEKLPDDKLDVLFAQEEKIRQAYDSYIRSLVSVRRIGAAYVESKWVPGIHVTALVERVTADLPTRVGDLESVHDAELKATARRELVASQRATKRVGRLATGLEWTDTAITVVQLLTGVVGGAKVVASKALAKAAAQGLTKQAARALAIKATVKFVAANAAVAAAGAAVVPPILSSTGLNESEIKVGMALLTAFQSIGALRHAHLKTSESVPKTSEPLVPKVEATPAPPMPQSTALIPTATVSLGKWG